MTFAEALYEAHLSNINKAAAFFGVTPRTVWRWLKNGAPKIAWRALELRCGLDSHWYGWRILRDQIIRHDGVCFDLHLLSNWEWLMQLERTRAWTAGTAAAAMPALIPVLNRSPDAAEAPSGERHKRDKQRTSQVE